MMSCNMQPVWDLELRYLDSYNLAKEKKEIDLG